MTETTGVIVSFRRGNKTQKVKEYLIRFSGTDSISKAGQLIGHKIAWPIGKRKCRGKIVSLHGKRGLVIARFRKGLPGDALRTLVEIIG